VVLPKKSGRGHVLVPMQLANVNPFYNRTRDLPLGERLKISVMAVTLFPIRIVGAIGSLLLACVVAKISILGLSDKQLEDPLSTWRQWLRTPVFWLSRLFLWFLGFLHLRVHGAPAPRHAAPIVVANHSSFMDIALVPILHCCAVSKSENGRIPLIGALSRALQVIFVDRGSHDSRTAVVQALRRRAMDHRFPRTLIFPEGTATNGSVIATFKNGAFLPGVPVQPVAVRYQFTKCDPSYVRGGPGLGGLVLRLACQMYNRMEITFLPPYAPSEAERADASLFASNVRARLAAELGVPMTRHSFDDVRLMTEARRLHLPPDVGAVEFGGVRAALPVTIEQTTALMRRFSEMDAKHSGLLERDQFVAALRRLGSKLSEQELARLFVVLDQDESGTLNFTEFLIGFALLDATAAETRRRALELVFDVFDAKTEGRLGRDWLAGLLQRAMPHVTEERCDELWREADEGGKGYITRDEFVAFASRHEKLLDTFRQVFCLAMH